MPTSAKKRNVIIIGAAGRDFHDFNVLFRSNPTAEVVAFTAAQIPDIDGRTYPAELAGPGYERGIPIYAESELPELIRKHKIDECVMSYSDLPHEEVMHKAAIVNAAGADLRIVTPRKTMLRSKKPVIAICAVRTGCGKSQTTRRVAEILHKMGKRVAAVRHPMPYGDLRKQVCQRFGELADLDRHKCTIEEREEYEPHIVAGNLVFAGIDYEKILRAAEKEADVILWDGGNNDLPFFAPNLHIVLADPHRPGHETAYFPGETNARMADVLLINKVGTAPPENVTLVQRNLRNLNPAARIIKAKSPVTVERPKEIAGKRVLCVEDGPTVTHGEMPIGAAAVAAEMHGAKCLVSALPNAVGSIKATFKKYAHLQTALPAMGYSPRQISELERTINKTDCDLVLIGTPIDLGALIKINKPHLRVRYELAGSATKPLTEEIERVVGTRATGKARQRKLVAV